MLSELLKYLNGIVQTIDSAQPPKNIPVGATMSVRTNISDPPAIDCVYDENNIPKTLNSMLARGGEGSVYPLREKPGILVKIYHQDKLEKHGSAYRDKIGAMISIKDQFQAVGACWPLLSVYDSRTNWIGYAMKQGSGVPMRKLAHAVAYKKNFPQLDRIQVVTFLINFLRTTRELHSRGVLIGDYNLQNFLCHPTSGAITMIDCDSYQVSINGRHYPCPVGSPDLTPVEHQNLDFNKVVRNERSEAFSVAIILFECLMLGRHPYDIVGGADPVSNLRNGDFAYGIGGGGIPKGPWYNIWSHMPFKMKQLFIQTFKEGARELEKRPSLQVWQNELSIYLQDLKKGYHSAEIMPSSPKPHGYHGNKKIQGQEP